MSKYYDLSEIIACADEYKFNIIQTKRESKMDYIEDMKIKNIQLYCKNGKYRAYYNYANGMRSIYDISKELYDEIELMLTHSPQQLVCEKEL